MTKQEWTTCNDPRAMLAIVWPTDWPRRPTDRKLRCTASALDGRVGDDVDDERGWRFLNTDGYRDESVTQYNLAAVGEPLMAGHAKNETFCGCIREIFGNPFRKVPFFEHGEIWVKSADSEPGIRRWVSVPWLTWRDGTVPKLAQAVYDDRFWGGMPILADALEEAGCVEMAILDHLRNPKCRNCGGRGSFSIGIVGQEERRLTPQEWRDGHSVIGNILCQLCRGEPWKPIPYCRGDWVLDLLLGKE